MPQDPNNTEEQQPEQHAGMIDPNPAEDGAAEAAPDSGAAHADEIQTLVDAAAANAADPAPGTSGTDAIDDSAGTPGATVAAQAAEEMAGGPLGQANGGEGAPVPAGDVAAASQAGSGSSGQESAPAGPRPQVPPDTTPFQPPDFGSDKQTAHTSQLDLLDDVELDVKVELGRTEMYIEDVLGMGAGSVVELDKAAGDPVDIFVNERLVARGEVLVLNDSFCVRINDILSPIPELEE